MENKIKTINGAIDMIYTLKKGETVKFGGSSEFSPKFSVSAKGNPKMDFNKRLSELFNERENLQTRVNRMLN